MTCAELRERLDRYHAGALPGIEVEQLEQHLLACEECRGEFRFLRELRARTAELPRAVAPSRNLWSGIEARISSRGSQNATPRAAMGWRRKLSLAAAAIILMALASTATAFFMHQRRPPVAVAGSNVQTIEAAYRETANDLAAALERQRATLDPAQITVIEHNLRIIDEAIRETRAALAEQPGNSKVADLLWASYEKKIDLLQRAASRAES